MKKILLTITCIAASLMWSYGQVYIDEFDDGTEQSTYYGTGYTSSEAEGEWTITGDGTGGAFELFGYSFYDENGAISIDVTENNKIYVRAKASSVGTQLRMDVVDADGFKTTLPGITKTLLNDYTVFEYDFSGQYQDGGYGGTSCETGPCNVDGTRTVNVEFYVNPGAGNFSGSVIIDFIAVGEEPQVGPMSDVFQDHFDSENSLLFLGSSSEGYVNQVSNSSWKIVGDGTNGMWEPVNYLLNNPTTLDTVDISVADGNNKVYIRMKSNVAGTAVRVDLQDINNMVTTAGSITKIISDEWVTYEYNYAGSYQDLAFGGTGCEVGPCDVDPTRIANMIVFINPGVEGFIGQVEIDYISVGTSLEADDGSENVLEYGEHFSDNSNFISTSGAYGLEVDQSILKITGDGNDAPFSVVTYNTHDENEMPVYVDATGNNKLFIRARSDAPNTLLRVDLADTTGYITTQPSFTRVLDSEFSILEIDFTSAYFDAAYGGTPCEEGPCPVDGTAINQVQLFPNPADGGFQGSIEIDYISFGAPLGEDVFKWSDNFDNADRSKFSDAGGFTVEETEEELIITGDGTAGAYTAFNFTPHNPETGEDYVLDITSNNKLYVRAKSTVDGVPLRIDLVDSEGFATTNPSVARNVGTEYMILEFDFTDTYIDGGFGGTSCTEGPCPVDGSVVSDFLIYVDPDNGGFNGTVTIDWMSIIEPLEDDGGEEVDYGPEGVDDYVDEFTDNSLEYLSDNSGLALSVEEGVLKVTGDGTSGAFAPVLYEMHSGADTVVVNAADANAGKLYIRMKTSLDSLPVRIDLQDNAGYLTSQAGLESMVRQEYEVHEYLYDGNYLDGGYGGTPCMAGPCDVDAKRIQFLQIYILPGEGAFSGELDIDWISFGQPLETSSINPDLVSKAQVYPNPSNGEVIIEMESLVSGPGIVSISDLSGRTVLLQKEVRIDSGNNTLKLNLDNLMGGLYFIQVNLGNRAAYTEKIIINK